MIIGTVRTPEDAFELTPCAILLSTKDEVFAYVDYYEDDSYILKDAFRIIRSWTSTGVMRIMYEPFCPYSDDTFTIISRDHVISMNELSDYYFKRYLEILNGTEATDDSAEDTAEVEVDEEPKTTLH